MSYTIKQLSKLRNMTGAGIMDCKDALLQANGIFEDAILVLRKKGMDSLGRRAEKVASEGLIETYVHMSKVGALVEVNCETDFVSRSDAFKQFAKDLAMHVVAANPVFISFEDITQEDLKMEFGQVIDEIPTDKLQSFKIRCCLMQQPFIKDTSITIGDMLADLVAKVGEKVVIKRFIRFELGQ